MKTWWLVLACGIATMLFGCSRLIGGASSLPPTRTSGPLLPAGVNVGRIMLDTPQMRGITGTDEHLTIIPTMELTSPVDIAPLAETLPPPCRFIYAETLTFGPEIIQFRKTTFQYPPKGGLISEGVATYSDAGAARRAFDALAATVHDCAETSAGDALVGDWAAEGESLHTRVGECGRAYRVKSVALMESTYCGFSESVPELVIVNLADNVPG